MKRVRMRLAGAGAFALLIAGSAATAQEVVPDVAAEEDSKTVAQDVAARPDADVPGADVAPSDDIAASADVAPSAEEVRDSNARSKVQALGDGSEQIYAVKHSGSWSMHAENVQATVIFALWHGVGGPSVASKEVLDFPFTMSVHQMKAERVVARILENYNYTLHYDNGNLSEVRVIGAIPARPYKTPRLVESRTLWTNSEVTLLTAGEPVPADKP